jgi:NADH-quinone oxidoreductase subunit D
MMVRTKINIGPIHPSTHGVLRLVVELEGDEIVAVEPHIGFLHRGVEKLLETRLYMQSPSYLEKLDYIAPLSWDDLFVSAVEQATGTPVKERAQYARTILLEFQRIASHLMWMGFLLNDLGQMFTMFMWCFRDRDEIIRFLEDISGSRMFYVNLRLGGLNSPLPPDFRDRAYKLADHLEGQIAGYPAAIEANPIFHERMKGVGVLTKDDAIGFGVSGPVLRGSGVFYDARRISPYYVYDKIKFRVPTKSEGDCFARYRVRYEEMQESIRIIRHALDSMPEGDEVGLPVKLVGPPAKQDTVIVSRELPRGEGMIYMVPDKQRPYRISLRSPAFSNLAVLPKLATGCKFADLFAILGSLDLVIAEIDR